MAECECLVARVTAMGLAWGGVGGGYGCLATVQLEDRAERPRWLWVSQDSSSFTVPAFPFISDVFKSENIY